MPLYEYACRRCEHTFEALVHDGDRVACPACRAEELSRLLSLPARPTAPPAGKPGACQAGPDVPPCGPACSRWS